MCKNEKCSCKDNYSWNTTAGACVAVVKTFTEHASTVVPTTEESTSTVVPTTEESTSTVALSTEESTNTASTSDGGTMTSSPEMMETSTEGDKRTFTKPSRKGSSTNANKKALNDNGKDAISPGMVVMNDGGFGDGGDGNDGGCGCDCHCDVG